MKNLFTCPSVIVEIFLSRSARPLKMAFGSWRLMAMEGIVTLLNGFAVNCVLSGGRVSLANLIEFSHFVDLFVLEDKILMNEHELAEYLDEFDLAKDSIIVPFPDSSTEDQIDQKTAWPDDLKLSHYAGKIAINTQLLYDRSPVAHQFSLDSYDYWLRLSGTERGNVPNSLREDRDDYYGINSSLLRTSYQFENDIVQLIEALGKTSYALMPSTRNLVPFMEAFHQFDTPAQILYRKVASKHRQMVEQIIALDRPRGCYVPPLLTILLSRCGTYKEIAIRLKELREEFAPLRSDIRTWLEEMNQAMSLHDQIKLREELDNTLYSATKRFEQRRRGFYRNVSGAVLDALEDGDLKDVLSKPAVALAKEGIDLLPDIIRSRRFTGVIDILDQAVNIEQYSRLLERVFGKSLDISQYEITQARRYNKVIESRYSINFVLPK